MRIKFKQAYFTLHISGIQQNRGQINVFIWKYVRKMDPSDTENYKTHLLTEIS
jgi:hypothetical protein